MNLIKKAGKILQKDVCDHCLGRQFAQIGSGYTNDERGSIIRSMTAKNAEIKINEKDLRKFKFDKTLIRPSENIKCSVCGSFFDKKNMKKWLDKIQRASRGLDYETFKIGTKLSDSLISNEEGLWERTGIDYCEPIKSEINREIGKLIEKHLKKTFSALHQDVTFILDIDNNKVNVEIKSIMFYAEYQKLKRGIPQTRWPSGKYKTSVEQIVAKPYLQRTGGTGTKFHGAGREDIDALCLGWRPFVLEILNPKKRLTLEEIRALVKKIPKSVKIRNLRFSDNKEIVELKEAKYEKSYKALVSCSTPIKKKDLGVISKLKRVISQKTPERVLHRRADLTRNRRVLSIKTKYINPKSFEITIRTESGTYIKELISGDNGRTQPNISNLLGIDCVCKKLDVTKIHI